MLLFLSSCGIFNPDKQAKTVDRGVPEEKENMVRIYNPATGLYESVPESNVKVDTVRLRDITRSSAKPITGIATEPEGKKKSAYKMSLLVPFYAIRYQNISDPIDARGRRFIQFYAGARLAIDDLMSEGFRVDLNVYDTEESNAKMQEILDDPAVRSSDLLIGAYRRSNIEALAAFSNKYKLPVVSPWIPAFDQGVDAPLMIQTTPGLEAHAHAIFAHIHDALHQPRVYLVGRDERTEMNRLERFRDAYLAAGLNPDSLSMLLIDDRTSDLHETDMTEIFMDTAQAVFVIPYYSRSDEDFVNNVLRKIHAERLDKNVFVYGLPQWMSFSNVNYDYFESLKVHVSTISFTDKYNPRFDSFQTRFFTRYGIVPEEPAFRGYDLVYYFGKALHMYGTHFIPELTGTKHGGLNLGFDLDPVYLEGPDRSAGRQKPRYIENRGIRILQFSQLQFQFIR